MPIQEVLDKMCDMATVMKATQATIQAALDKPKKPPAKRARRQQPAAAAADEESPEEPVD